MQTLTAQPKLLNTIGHGVECSVYNTPDFDVVFKLYNDAFNPYPLKQVERIIKLNREYAAQGLAPQVYSDAIMVNGCWGYLVERIHPLEYDSGDISPDKLHKHIDELAYQLGVSDNCKVELNGNSGLTKDGDFVLFDFGLVTMTILGLIPYDVST